MKALLREFWTSWETWVAIAGAVMALAALVTAGLWIQRESYQHTLEAVNLQTVQQIKADVQRLIDETREAAEERQKIRQAVEPLKGLPKAVEVLRDAAKVDGKP